MIPAAFTYHRPKTIDAALRMLAELGPDAKILAGGQSLMVLMKLRLSSPAHVIDISQIAGLRRFHVRDGQLRLGALVTHWTMESAAAVRRASPLLAETAAAVGDLQVRNLGTLGGSLAHADPAADYPATMLALDAGIVLRRQGAERTVPATDFFQGVMATAMQGDELIVEIQVPVAAPRFGAAYLKMPNSASGFALTGVAATVGLDGDERATHIRVGITGVGPAAYRAWAVEEGLIGRELTDDLLATASQRAADGVEANADIHATAPYRQHLARVFTRRALALARDRARGPRASRRAAGAPRAG